MKINKIIVKIILLIILIAVSSSCTCYARVVASPTDEEGGSSNSSSTSSGGSGSVGLPNLNDSGYKPTVSQGRATSIISSILGVLMVVGIIAIVVSIALIGFNMIVGSASEKAVSQEKLVGVVIAALVLTGGSIIAKIIISLAEKF